MAEKSHKLSQVMKVSRNGQISLPAHVRARWNCDEVHVVEMKRFGDSDHLLIFPVIPLEEALARGRGIDKGKMPPTDEIRRRMREEDLMIEERKRREGVIK
jgi:bifunctional DNA-binding transcriptional regulator/antitoxin component of YhaV-PrlF toxin-antitoxin module